jgi:catechol 2,3-dioxygenase-like lactoylglutathione lyase family enzyme
MIDHIDFAVVDLEVSRKFYKTVLATLGIESFMDIKTEEGREGTGYGD